MYSDDEMALGGFLLGVVVALLFPHPLRGTAPATPRTMQMRWFRLQKGRALHYIMPFSFDETMESLMKRAQDRHYHGVFRFTKEVSTAYKTGKKRLYVKLVKNACELEKSDFAKLSANDVYKMTDDNPVRLELCMKDKVGYVPENDVLAIF
jgi:hypothetical protein